MGKGWKPIVLWLVASLSTPAGWPFFCTKIIFFSNNFKSIKPGAFKFGMWIDMGKGWKPIVLWLMASLSTSAGWPFFCTKIFFSNNFKSIIPRAFKFGMWIDMVKG